MFCVNKKFSVLIFHKFFTHIFNYTLHSIVGLKEMSVNLPYNVLAKKYLYLLHF